MNNENDIRSFGGEDIRRYLSGNMSPEEMHALERAALEDPLLADAIDGYATQPGFAEHSESLNALRADLARRVRPNVVPMKRNRWWLAAAAVLVVAGAGGILFFLTPAGDGGRIAKNEVSRTASPEADTIANNGVAQAPQAQASMAEAKETRENRSRELKREAPAQAQEIERSMATVPRPESQKEIIPEDAVVAMPRSAPARTEAEAGMAEAKDMAARAPSRAKMAPYEVRGKVVTPDNKPIANVAVTDPDNNILAHTDTAGRFRVDLPNAAVTLGVESAGYDKARVSARDADENHIVLHENATVLQGRVAGVSVTKQKRAARTTEDALTAPVTGWSAYEDYVRNNLRRTGIDSGIRGQVIVSFEINRRGNPTNIRIERSLGKAADAEARRLIKDGPSWVFSSGSANKATISIKF